MQQINLSTQFKRQIKRTEIPIIKTQKKKKEDTTEEKEKIKENKKIQIVKF
jgi:hypothetical protein